jgi:4-hydroxy-4-methyl-2-oxoglutarate aldolase
MSNTALSKESLERLRKVDTPTVCNVIELFDVRPRNAGYMDRRIQSCFPELAPMVGYASTATFRSAAPARGNAYATLEQQVAAFSQVPSPAVVVFQDLDDPSVAATFGEVMCTTYKAFGASGLVTSGAGRDLDQVHALEFPAFTNGTICAHGYCHIPSVQVPVHVGGLTIHPGDLLHGDCNGVTTIPLDIASDVADACEEFVQAEAVVLQYLRAGEVTVDGFSQATAECRRLIDALRERVARDPQRTVSGGPTRAASLRGKPRC